MHVIAEAGALPLSPHVAHPVKFAFTPPTIHHHHLSLLPLILHRLLYLLHHHNLYGLFSMRLVTELAAFEQLLDVSSVILSCTYKHDIKLYCTLHTTVRTTTYTSTTALTQNFFTVQVHRPLHTPLTTTTSQECPCLPRTWANPKLLLPSQSMEPL